jgi:polyribonucleotide nucleotidyltransferase
MKKIENKVNIGGKDIKFSSGDLAGQADGAVLVESEGTAVLATCVVSKEPSELDYMPLMVDYEERFYASGKISGSRFIKREGRPSEQAILTSRLIDRPLRPLFPKDLRHEVQVIVTVLSYDRKADPDILAMLGASAAVMQSPAPFAGPVGSVRVALINDKLVVNPTCDEAENSDLDLVVAGTEERILMIEAKSKEVPEDKVIEAIEFAKVYIKESIEAQKPFTREDRFSVESAIADIELAVKKQVGSRLHQVLTEVEESEREIALEELKNEVLNTFEGQYKQSELEEVFESFIQKEVRRVILSDGIRPDGRKLEEIRPIDIKVGILPRTHGSALFTRGQTQALTVTTLASPGMEQFIDTMEVETTKRYMHFYNFPPFCTGEVQRLKGVSRREVGHGSLAEKAILPVLPSREDFPYTIRLVTEILSSNGSSSMAATCGSSLALMDAGVPIKSPVAGIAMGMVSQDKDSTDKVFEGVEEDEKYKFAILTDLQGLEDFGGDMDFKVTGTEKGITAIQLDVKIDGLSMNMIKSTLEKAKTGRMYILDKMNKIISSPREQLSLYAPRIIKININPNKIGELIGPGGKNIQQIITDCGGKDLVAVDIEDDGTVLISSTDAEAARKAQEIITGQTASPELNKVYEGEVKAIQKDRNSGKEIGAIVEFMPGKDGMVHISEISDKRIGKVSDELKVGQRVRVKVINVDEDRGRVALSVKKAKDANAPPVLTDLDK